MKQYIRDKRSPVPSSERASKVMSSIKAKNTKPEILFRKELRKAGIRNYRLHSSGLPGRPDVIFPSKKLAIFIHGCYWHRCPTCNLAIPKSNSSFWQDKFDRNINRDHQKVEDLVKLGWVVLVFWECQIKSEVECLIENVRNRLKKVENLIS